MRALTFSAKFIIFLVIANSCERLQGDTRCPVLKSGSSNLLDTFDDVGAINIKVAKTAYTLRGNNIYVAGSYSDPEVESTALTKINYQTNDSFTTWAISPSVDGAQSFPLDLGILSLETTHLYNLTSDTFKWLTDTNIRYLNLGRTVIKNIAEDTFKPLETNLRILSLANATVSDGDLNALMKGLCGNSSLFVLSLASLGLKKIPRDVLESVQYSLRSVSFFNNDFKTTSSNISEPIQSVDLKKGESEFHNVVKNGQDYLASILQETTCNDSTGSPWGDFPLMPYLTELDLRQCNIDSIERGTFRNLMNLKKLYLSGNKIIRLPDLAFEGLTNLQVLDISRNLYPPADNEIAYLSLGVHSFGDLFSLRTLNLSNSAICRSSSHFVRTLPITLVSLDLRGTDLTNIRSKSFENLTNLQSLDLSYNLGLGTALSEKAFAGLGMLQELIMVKTSLSSLDAFRDLSSLKVLDVKQNSLNCLEGVLENLPLLECLDVSYNFVNAWVNVSVFASNPKLKGVFLRSNSLGVISTTMLEEFKKLTYLTLGYNKLICNCMLKDFMEYLVDLNNGSAEVLPILTDYQEEGESYVCTDVSVSKTVRLIDTHDYCKADTSHWLSGLQHGIYISLLTMVCTLSAGGLIYWKWWYIRYVAVIFKNATVMGMINVENCEDRIYTYDVFVSYSDENRNWVIEEFLPNIEGPDARFNICLHERDFQVGVSILENIIMGMDQSRTIVLIISAFFIKSQWCQFEMHLAQHRLLETCREELVLVLLEEIPRRKRPKTLHYLMMVKTYIIWPKDSEDNAAKKLFWKRLRKAITANKSKRTSAA